MLTAQIHFHARQLGFDAVGIAAVPSDPVPSSEETFGECASLSRQLWERLKRWLSLGFHGSMGWMARDPYRRSHPQEVLPGCRSIVVVGMNYRPEHEMPDLPSAGRVARYAWGKDYHTVLSDKLSHLEKIIHGLCPGTQTRCYVDTGPIMEKPWAQAAGIGWVGKHTNLVSTEFGSWLVLGEILTTLPLEPNEPGTDLCGTCSLCIQACPTGALVGPYLLDAERCISYLTIEYRGTAEDLPEDLRNNMGNKVFGCDDCLEVCPYNVNEHPTKEPGFKPLPLTRHLLFEDLSAMTREQFQTMTQNSALRRPKFEGFMRNVQIGLANFHKHVSPTPPR